MQCSWWISNETTGVGMPPMMRIPSSSGSWMVKRSGIGEFGGMRLQGHDPSVGSEVLGLSSRVPRAVPSPQMQTEEPAEASYGLARAATLTVLARRLVGISSRNSSSSKPRSCVHMYA